MRIDLGENPANMAWLWGHGKKPKMPSFKERFGVAGSSFTQTDSSSGLCALLGFKRSKDLSSAIESGDLVFVYKEWQGDKDLKTKVRLIEEFDSQVVGACLKQIGTSKDYRICITMDYIESIVKKSRIHGHVPFLLQGNGVASDGQEFFNEKTASQSKSVLDQGHLLMNTFLSR